MLIVRNSLRNNQRNSSVSNIRLGPHHIPPHGEHKLATCRCSRNKRKRHPHPGTNKNRISLFHCHIHSMRWIYSAQEISINTSDHLSCCRHCLGSSRVSKETQLESYMEMPNEGCDHKKFNNYFLLAQLREQFNFKVKLLVNWSNFVLLTRPLATNDVDPLLSTVAWWWVEY